MADEKSGYIDHLDIYRQTDAGKDIFAFYFPGYEFGSSKAFISIRAVDKTPSARINFFQGLWRITDFGDQANVNSMPAIHFVMFREGLVYKDALRFIRDVIKGHKYTASEFTRPIYAAEYSFREMNEDDKKGTYNFTYKEQPSESDLQSIGRYVTAELLAEYNCRPVLQYEYCGHSKKMNRDVVHIFKSTDTYPVFVFDYGDFKKLYKPYDPEKKNRFLYVGTKPKDYIYGLKQLRNSKNEFVNSDGENPISPPEHKPNAIVHDLYRCSGESDSLNMASLGLHVYWLNSEVAEMTKEQWNSVDELCENHYQVMDLDTTGHESALKFALKHINLYTVYLPDFIKLKNDWRGNPCKDVKDYINIFSTDLEDAIAKINVLKRAAMPMKFWVKHVDEKTRAVSYSINLEYYYHFLAAHGFRVMESKYHRKAGYCYAKINSKVIELIHPDDIKRIIKRFTKEWIRSKNLVDQIAILNKINSSNQINEANLGELPQFSPVFKNHNATTEYLHFRNRSLRITKEAIDVINHDQVPNFILGKLEINDKLISHIIDRNIQLIRNPMIEVNPSPAYKELMERLENAKTSEEREIYNAQISIMPYTERFELKINDNEFIFIRFLRDISHIYWRDELENKLPLTDQQRKEQDLAFINLLFVLGWLVSQYKDPARPWLVFLQDMKITQVGKSSGRSGKSLYSMAVHHTRPTFYIGGRRNDITQKTEFIYDGYTRFHNNIEIDDLYEYADFNFFYTQVTGKREINSKYISKQILDYDESGKMLISSNFELMNTDPSTLARILNAGVSDYYHEATKYNDYKETRTPLTKFGKKLYDDFTEEEWIKFYNLIAYCLQLQMRFFKIQPPMGNLEKRQLRREMTRGLSHEEEFWIWANNYFVHPPADFTDEIVEPSTNPNTGYYNRYVVKDAAFESFISTLPKATGQKYKITQFKKSLQAFCDYYGFDFNPESKCNQVNKETGSRRIIKDHNGETKEMIFISTANARPENINYQCDNDEAHAAETDDNFPF